MELRGKVVDQSNGNGLDSVTIWEISPDGQAAQVIGFSDYAGNYDVNVNNAGSNINFVQDGYLGVNIPASQALLSDQVLLQKEGSVSAKLTLSGFPKWVWYILAIVGVYYIADGNKKK